jgi:hypothetical protein
VLATHLNAISPLRYQLVHPDQGRRCLAYAGAASRPPLIWTLVGRLTVRLPILVICRDVHEANLFHNFFERTQVPHFLFCGASRGGGQNRVNELQYQPIPDDGELIAEDSAGAPRIRPRRGGRGRLRRESRERPAVPVYREP